MVDERADKPTAAVRIQGLQLSRSNMHGEASRLRKVAEGRSEGWGWHRLLMQGL